METLPFDRDVQIQDLGDFSRRGKLQARAGFGNIANDAINGGAAAIEINKGPEETSVLSGRAPFFYHWLLLTKPKRFGTGVTIVQPDVRHESCQLSLHEPFLVSTLDLYYLVPINK